MVLCVRVLTRIFPCLMYSLAIMCPVGIVTQLSGLVILLVKMFIRRYRCATSILDICCCAMSFRFGWMLPPVSVINVCCSAWNPLMVPVAAASSSCWYDSVGIIVFPLLV